MGRGLRIEWLGISSGISIIFLVIARGSDESRYSDPYDVAKQCSISSDVFFESEDEPEGSALRKGRIQSNGADGALTMESLEEFSDIHVSDISASRDPFPSNESNGALKDQRSPPIAASDSAIGSPTRSTTPEEGDGGLFSVSFAFLNFAFLFIK